MTDLFGVRNNREYYRRWPISGREPGFFIKVVAKLNLLSAQVVNGTRIKPTVLSELAANVDVWAPCATGRGGSFPNLWLEKELWSYWWDEFALHQQGFQLTICQWTGRSFAHFSALINREALSKSAIYMGPVVVPRDWTVSLLSVEEYAEKSRIKKCLLLGSHYR